MWNKDKSITLSLFCVRLFAVILVGLCASAPWLFKRFTLIRFMVPQQMLSFFLVTVYAVAVPAALALWHLHGLLAEIRKNDVFTHANVARLRALSWCCLAAGLICLASTLYYMPFLALAAAGAFMALILRVVKNVFEQAVALKDENDFTI